MPVDKKKNSSGKNLSQETPQKKMYGACILIVEDNKINQLLLKNILKKFGFLNFDCAENGKVALECLAGKDYDLILMDIQMPEMDGYEITNTIRTRMRESIRHVPVIALSADANEKVKAAEQGMNDYLVKPYTPDDLYSFLVKYLDHPHRNHDGDKKVKSSPGKNQKPAAKKSRGMNLSFLDKLTGGNSAVTIQLIELFLKEIPDSIEKLEDLVSKEDWKEVHRVAHKVKSGIAVFELTELKKTILSIEEYSRENVHTENIPTLFEFFRRGCRQAVLDLREELKKLKQSGV
ncbi:MAG: response regulator [Bacteroidetes bacterium]|nr:response regulator [Bacteroidota bacterium]